MINETTQAVHYIHRMSYSMQEKLVGTFILFALGLFFFLFFINGKTTHLFENYINLHLYVQNAEGISSETPVRISGIEVGKVDRVEISSDHRIHISIRVYERYQSLLRQDSIAAIGKLSLLGRSSIEITAGSPSAALLENDTVLTAEEPLSVNQLISELTPVMRAVEESVQRFAQVMSVIEPDKINEIIVYLHMASSEVQAITEQLSKGQGAVGMALYDENFQQQLGGSMQNMESLLVAAVQRLNELDPILGNVDQITRQASQASEKLPEFMEETTHMVRNVNTSLSSLNVEIQQLPELITRMNSLMEQTDRMLEGIGNSWLFSNSGSAQRRQQIDVQAPHE